MHRHIWLSQIIISKQISEHLSRLSVNFVESYCYFRNWIAKNARETREIWVYTPALLFTFVYAHYKFNMFCANQNRETFLKSRICFFGLRWSTALWNISMFGSLSILPSCEVYYYNTQTIISTWYSLLLALCLILTIFP